MTGKEHSLPFAKFPWFREATIAELSEVECPMPGHFYWPRLDVDLDTERIEHPERLPLVARARPSERGAATRTAKRTTSKRAPLKRAPSKHAPPTRPKLR
jgi:hypothetical protein